MFRPVLLSTPLPASGNHCQSFPVCAPYLAWEKLASLDRPAPNFATHPMMGMVSMGSAPPARLWLMNVSPCSPAVELAYAMLSKYQSLPRLSAFCIQL
ncbi:MAG: hypothetical protein IANPNBLG_01053 [Bryobacteraceae bacterium]|nr:hypothetical protein [Bryobacteraceae bacterium]